MRRTNQTLRTGGSLVLLLLSMLAAGAEPVVLPPVWTETHWVQLLTSSQMTRAEQLEIGHYLSARTNVRPLLQSSVPEQPSAGKHGYYRFASLGELRLRLSRWQFSYAFGVADEFHGDQGAVLLYLGGMKLTEFPTEDVHVSATLNRSAVNRWTVEHLVPLENGYGEGWLLLAGSLYLVRRVQQGTLSGTWQSMQFDGNLHLDTTRGLPPSETRSVGLGIHLAWSLPLSERWRIAFWGENLLGHIQQRRLQRITARVQANTIVPDADGFLHAAPLLSGRIDYFSEELPLQRRLTLGLAYRQGRGAWLLFASRDADDEFSIGYASSTYWFLLSLPRGEWRAAYRAKCWELAAGLSAWNPSRAKCATLYLRWSAPLGR